MSHKIYLKESLDVRDCREQFLQEYEAFTEKKRAFEAEMKAKYEDLSRREHIFISKMRKETENLTDYADRLAMMEQARNFTLISDI